MLQLHAALVRRDDVVVALDAGERIQLDEVVALLSAARRRHRLAALVEADVARRIHYRSVPQIPAVVDLVELAPLVPSFLRL